MKCWKVVLYLAASLIASGCGGGSGGDSSSSSSVPLSSSSSNSSTASSSSESAESRGETTPIVETEPENWYVRLTAEASARGLSTENAQIGQLDRADARAENLEAFAPFTGGYIDIVILENNVSREYKGSFHPYAAGEADQWRFAVKTDDNSSNVILSWRGLYVLNVYEDDAGRQRYRERVSLSNPLLQKMQIVDEESGMVVPVMREKGKSFLTFNMDGKTERFFRWELLTQQSEGTAGAPELRVQYARSLFNQFESAAPKPFNLAVPPNVKMPMTR